MPGEIISIKGTRNGLVICLDSTRDFEELKRNLKSKIESARGFFKGAKFVFHVGYNPLPADQTKELEDICCAHGLIPNRDFPWPANLAVHFGRPTGEENRPAAPGRAPEPPEGKNRSDNVRPLIRQGFPSLPSAGITAADRKPCLLINRSIRSGQKVNYQGNVVVLGDVNPGSEITASGDVVVMGSLRGLVHAGAGGDREAIIMAYRLDPVQLRIATVISRPPDNNQVGTGPEIARLSNGRMVIEPYLTYGLKK